MLYHVKAIIYLFQQTVSSWPSKIQEKYAWELEFQNLINKINENFVKSQIKLNYSFYFINFNKFNYFHFENIDLYHYTIWFLDVNNSTSIIFIKK